MRTKNLFITVLALAALTFIFVGCGTDTTAASSNGDEVIIATTEPATDEHADDEAAHEADEADHAADEVATVEAEHEEDIHASMSAEEHEAWLTEAAEHSHGAAVVDPDAPVVHLFAIEFGYTPGDFEVEAGHAFTIMLHNEGLLEHDVTIESEEGQGGIHLQPGEDGMATFELHEPGTYTYYCTVPGHRDAGMTGTLTVVADEDGHDDDDHA